MADFEVREVDVDDEALLHAWWKTTRDAMAGLPVDVSEPWESARRTLPRPHGDHEQTLLAAYDDEVMVGAAMQVLPIADNLANAYGDVNVAQAHRRRGAGSALLAELEVRARARDRRHHILEVLAPLGVVGPGEQFAAAHGYAVANREGLKVLDLRDHPDWAALDAKVASRIGDYRVVEWGNFTPEKYRQPVCDALNVFVGMVPTGDLALDDISLTPERLVREERRSDDLDRRRFCAVAVATDGTLAGYSDLFVTRYQEAKSAIGITMVQPEHRGHGLGLALKLATHRSLLTPFPQCEIVRTGNADANVQMNAVNEQLGYRLVEQILEVQKHL